MGRGGASKDANSLEGVVRDIVDHLDDPFKKELRHTSKDNLIQYHHTWGTSIRNKYQLWTNEALRRSCSKQAGKDVDINADDASMIIIEAVWEKLQK
jgi:hypothetical protein